MKLIKLTDDHYVIVNNSEIKVGDIVLETYIDGSKGVEHIQTLNDIDILSQKKITHSTDININELYYISLQEVKELIGEVDVEKKYNETWLAKYQPYDSKEGIAFKTGYNQALEDNKEKKYTEDDMRKAYMVGQHGGVTQTHYEFDEYIQQLQPKTEWEVEMIDGQLKLK